MHQVTSDIQFHCPKTLCVLTPRRCGPLMSLITCTLHAHVPSGIKQAISLSQAVNFGLMAYSASLCFYQLGQDDRTSCVVYFSGVAHRKSRRVSPASRADWFPDQHQVLRPSVSSSTICSEGPSVITDVFFFQFEINTDVGGLVRLRAD